MGTYGTVGFIALPIFKETLNIGSYKIQKHHSEGQPKSLHGPGGTHGQPFGDLCSDNNNHYYQTIHRVRCFITSCVTYSSWEAAQSGVWKFRLEIKSFTSH